MHTTGNKLDEIYATVNVAQKLNFSSLWAKLSDSHVILEIVQPIWKSHGINASHNGAEGDRARRWWCGGGGAIRCSRENDLICWMLITLRYFALILLRVFYVACSPFTRRWLHWWWRATATMYLHCKVFGLEIWSRCCFTLDPDAKQKWFRR